MTLDMFNAKTAKIWELYHVTVEEEDLGGSVTLKSLEDITKTFRWIKHGPNVSFTRMKTSYADRLASSGTKTLTVHDGAILSYDAEELEIDLHRVLPIISSFKRKVWSVLFSSCDLLCPVGFTGRERGRIASWE